VIDGSRCRSGVVGPGLIRLPAGREVTKLRDSGTGWKAGPQRGSRNLSVRGNLCRPGNTVSFGGQLPGEAILPDAKEKQVNIPALDRWAVGDLNAISETGDAVGIRERDFPSLLRV
jgi:hypothetical protein